MPAWACRFTLSVLTVKDMILIAKWGYAFFLHTSFGMHGRREMQLHRSCKGLQGCLPFNRIGEPPHPGGAAFLMQAFRLLHYMI